MRIGILSQWYDPETGPAMVPGILAREFATMGHDVRALTGFPNYPSGVIYPGYKQRIRATESASGVRVTRVPLYPSHDGSALRRAANYLSFGASATLFGTRALAHADFIWAYNSPVTVSAPLLAHSRWGRRPFFLHVQDLWPDSLLESGMMPGGWVAGTARSSIERVVRLTENRAAAIGVISPSLKNLILRRHSDIDPDRIVYVPNPTDESRFYPLTENKQAVPDVPWIDEFVVMYVGAIGDVQGLDTVLDAAELLRGEAQIRFVIVGDGIARERLEETARSRHLENVTFTGRISTEDVPRYMKTASVQLVSLSDREFLRYTTPSKISSLLASAVPIIGQIAGDGETLIKSACAGLTSRPGDADALANAVISMSKYSRPELSRIGAAGRRFYEQHLTARKAAQKILTGLGLEK